MTEKNGPIIDIRDLRKTYRDGLVRRRRIEALRGVSLQVNRGEVFGLLGPNGAGKTTMIKVLLGIVKKSGGDATMLGLPAGNRLGRRQVGYLPESHRIPRHLTGFTALEYYGGLSGVSTGEVKRQRGELLDQVGLGEWGRTSVRKYSKGMLQRLGLAQAMLHKPELLILDEPTDGVDPLGRSEMRVVLKRLKDEGKTVFLNSHLLQEVELICDRVAILHQGEVLKVSPVSELTSNPSQDVTFVLLGDEAAIGEALKEQKPQVTRQDDGSIEVVVSVATQQQLDSCVDALRLADIGISSITRERMTLEEAFLEIVQ